MKTYKVKIEYRIRETIEVEAKDEEEAETLALEQFEINPLNAECYSVEVQSSRKGERE